jgi:hypothetical protein
VLSGNRHVGSNPTLSANSLTFGSVVGGSGGLQSRRVSLGSPRAGANPATLSSLTLRFGRRRFGWSSVNAASRSARRERGESRNVGTTGAQDKAVPDVDANQAILLPGLTAYQHRATGDIRPRLLDGHFTLLSASGATESVGVDVFRAISPVAVLLVETSAVTVHTRLSARAADAPRVELIQRLAEREHAVAVHRQPLRASARGRRRASGAICRFETRELTTTLSRRTSAYLLACRSASRRSPCGASSREVMASPSRLAPSPANVTCSGVFNNGRLPTRAPFAQTWRSASDRVPVYAVA